jgi:hypothetical protein
VILLNYYIPPGAIGSFAFILAAKFRKPVPIVIGILIATLTNHAFAGALGSWITLLVGPQTLRWVLGISFLGMAIWTLIPDKFDEKDAKLTRFGVFGTTHRRSGRHLGRALVRRLCSLFGLPPIPSAPIVAAGSVDAAPRGQISGRAWRACFCR